MAKIEKKKPITFKVPPQLHRLLRMRAAREDKTIEAVATDALARYLGAADEVRA